MGRKWLLACVAGAAQHRQDQEQADQRRQPGAQRRAAALAVVVWAMAVNRFFSPVVRIQTDRGHHLITSGPYRYVRHPGYAGALLLFLGGGLTLGSWLALLLNLAMIPAMIRRTVIEDRCLWQELDGYAPYAETVRYRLIPGVW